MNIFNQVNSSLAMMPPSKHIVASDMKPDADGIYTPVFDGKTCYCKGILIPVGGKMQGDILLHLVEDPESSWVIWSCSGGVYSNVIFDKYKEADTVYKADFEKLYLFCF
jgi:hypothetical protein